MNTKVKFGIGILVIILVVAGALVYSRRVAASNSLTNMSPTDAMTYRYTAMAKYYMEKASASGTSSSLYSVSGYPLAGTSLNTLSVVDATAFRYQAMANYYATHLSASR